MINSSYLRHFNEILVLHFNFKSFEKIRLSHATRVKYTYFQGMKKMKTCMKVLAQPD